jgi:hypothetical protein
MDVIPYASSLASKESHIDVFVFSYVMFHRVVCW